jgi:S1-C subfamily serine protease
MNNSRKVFLLEQTVTAGIVSAKGRTIGSGPQDDFVQTDASQVHLVIPYDYFNLFVG